MEPAPRDDLIAWREYRSRHVVDLTALTAHIRARRGERFPEDQSRRFEEFAKVVTRTIEPAVATLEAHRDYPRLLPYDEIGRRVDRVEFHPAQTVAATATWAGGLAATSLDENGAFELAGLFFLLAHVGEGGQCCPLVCTVGLRRALERRGSPELQDRYLGALRSRDVTTAMRGSQFLTEVQGGSDVGSNVTRAVLDSTGERWLISGEKWFCSVADADLFAVTARTPNGPPGTRGLGCFLVPRTIDGVTTNGFRIRRLKDKLGTRALASGEIDFDGAIGWPLGEVTEGFDVAVTELLNTSRWLNALGSTGIMSRACLEAASFARHRHAFGRPVADFDAVRAQLAEMRMETLAALASSVALTELVGKIDEGTASPRDVSVHRFLVNANKFVTSAAATRVVHVAIEILGGNGTIEDFSCLPRLYRDAVVYESWEGTHNVLCAQVRRDCAKMKVLSPVEQWLRDELNLVSARWNEERSRIHAILDGLMSSLTKTVADAQVTDATFRHQLSGLVRAIQSTCLLRVADSTSAAPSDRAAIRGFLLFWFREGGSQDTPRWLEFVDEIVDAMPDSFVL